MVNSLERKLINSSPVATKDLEQAKKDLDKFGFCFIPNVLTDSDLQEAKQRLIEQAEAEEEQGVSFRDGGLNQNVYLSGNKVNSLELAVVKSESTVTLILIALSNT